MLQRQSYDVICRDVIIAYLILIQTFGRQSWYGRTLSVQFFTSRSLRRAHWWFGPFGWFEAADLG